MGWRGARGSWQGHRVVPWVWLPPHPAEWSRPEHGEWVGGGRGDWRGVGGPGKTTVRRHGSGRRHTLQNRVNQNMVSEWKGGEWGWLGRGRGSRQGLRQVPQVWLLPHPAEQS